MVESVQSPEDFEAHKRGYDNFIKGAKWGVGLVVAILILMAIFLL